MPIANLCLYILASFCLDKGVDLAFGVAGENGSVALERSIETIEPSDSMAIDVYGVDTGAELLIESYASNETAITYGA
jgi:hypothetical protein